MTATGSYRSQEGAWIFPSVLVVLAVLVIAARICQKSVDKFSWASADPHLRPPLVSAPTICPKIYRGGGFRLNQLKKRETPWQH
jgi:hypothetical protein